MQEGIFILPDHLGNGGITLFSGAQEVGNPIEINGFSLALLTNRLDNNFFPFYTVFIEDTQKTTKGIPVRFVSDPPDFFSYGLSTKQTNDGIVIYMTSLSFSLLNGNEPQVIIKENDWIENKEKYHNLGKLYHLGILQDLPSVIRPHKFEFEKYITVLNQTYGTNGSLEESFSTIFERVKFASFFFCLDEASSAIRQLQKFDTIYFGSLLSPISNSMKTSGFQRLLPSFQETASPVFTLLSLFKYIFSAIKFLDSSIKNIESNQQIINFVHAFQRSNNFNIGNCDLKTASKIIEKAKMAKSQQLPLFRMAEIDISDCIEPDFPQMPLIKLKEDTNDDTEKIIKSLNDVIMSNNDPISKIKWMKEEIEEGRKETVQKAIEIFQKVQNIERRIEVLAQKVRENKENLNGASLVVKDAAKNLEVVHMCQINIQNKYGELKRSLNEEQKRTRRILIVGLIFLLPLLCIQIFVNKL